jgi:hypothetical protein
VRRHPFVRLITWNVVRYNRRLKGKDTQVLGKKQISIIVLAYGCSALAQQPPKTSNTNAAESITKVIDSTIFTSMTLEQFQKIVQAMGFECTRGKDANGKDDTFFAFRAEGYKVAAFVPDPSYLELYNAFTDVAPTPIVTNEWNQSNRFSRAYVDKDGNATIEDDLILSGGVTRENVQGHSGTLGTFRHRPQTKRCPKVG